MPTDTPSARLVGPPPRCGAGHLCCDEPDGPPFHDHFLYPAECPACQRTLQARRAAGSAPESGAQT